MGDDLFPIKISKSTKCLHRPFNRAVASGKISDFQMVVKVEAVLQLEVAPELILKIIMTMMTSIVNFLVQKTNQHLYLLHSRFSYAKNFLCIKILCYFLC